MVITVLQNEVLSVLVQISGWICFFAWSICFYPQIWLNFRRKSVIGLNFDFLLLNTIGFACYTVYNGMLYFNSNIRQLYIERHSSHSVNPVLINDVVLSAHAIFAWSIVIVQCLIYERGSQRISTICRCWASLLLCFCLVSLAMALLPIQFFNWLDFINNLSYVKMAISLSKYFPQAVLNYRQKSTVGWSIVFVLLDFLGGLMNICQMCLQAMNVDDWSAFTGNPVKFILGLFSIFFNLFFIIQHYVLYREKDWSKSLKMEKN